MGTDTVSVAGVTMRVGESFGGVYVTYIGEPAALIAAGIDPALVGPGRKGSPRKDAAGDRVIRYARGKRVSVTFHKPIERAAALPGVAEWLRRNPQLPSELRDVWDAAGVAAATNLDHADLRAGRVRTQVYVAGGVGIEHTLH